MWFLIWGFSGSGCFALLFMGCWMVGISDADFNHGALLSFCTLHDGMSVFNTFSANSILDSY